MTKLNISSPSETQKGILLVIGGTLILLYAFNVFKDWLNIIVIIGGFVMIAYGIVKLGGLQKLRQWTSKGPKHPRT